MLQLLSFPLFLHLVHSQQRICDPVGSGVYAGGRGWHDQTTIPLWWGGTRWWYLNTYFTSVSYVVFFFFFALKPDKFKIWDFFFLLSVPTNFMVTLISIYEVTMLLPCLSPAHTAINWMPSGREGICHVCIHSLGVFCTESRSTSCDWVNEAEIQLSSITSLF